MLRLVIFDFDGVIVNSEPMHYAKFREVLLEWGEDMAWEEYSGKYLALNDNDCFEAVMLDRGWRRPGEKPAKAGAILSGEVLRKMCARKEELYAAGIAAGLPAVPGTIGFIRRAAGHHALAVASGSLHSEVLAMLAPLGIKDLFSAIVGADDVTRGKPDPEPFLKAMEAAGAALGTRFVTGECAVIEDSIVGVESAKNAGMKCIALTTSYPREKHERADLVVDTLDVIEVPVRL
jgi:HAD superfamily hydrolase (TIGR01509 family)